MTTANLSVYRSVGKYERHDEAIEMGKIAVSLFSGQLVQLD
jgi:hypothetical protein